MSFRRYGGLNYAPKNNIMASNYNNINNLSVSEGVGQSNSYINFLSDISGNININGDLFVSRNIVMTGVSGENFIQFPDQSQQFFAGGSRESQWNRSINGVDIYNINSGNVGIGTQNPQYKLDVNGNTSLYGNLNVSGNAIVSGNIGTTSSGKITSAGLLTASNALTVSSGLLTVNSSGIRFSDNTTQTTASQWTTSGNNIYNNNSGNVGIGTYDPQYNLDVSGNIYVAQTCYAAKFQISSDYRIKENILSLDDTYNVDNLRPVTYFNTKLEKQDIGVIAHELQEIYPELVIGEKDGKDMQSVNYTGLIPILIKEIQDLKKNNVELTNQLLDLKKIVEKLLE
jgi:hypothetical protein